MKNVINRIIRSKSFSRRSFILTAVAVLEIIAILITSTDSWVETISAILITNRENTQGTIMHSFYQTALFSGRSDIDAIDLSDYFRPSSGMHLVAASSPNGRDMFFRNASFLYDDDGGEAVLWRKGTSDDKNTNYISISLNVENASYFAFSQVPTIKLGNTVVNDNLVRVAIGINDDVSTFKVFGRGVAAGRTTTDSGVINSGTGGTGSLTINSFSDYIYDPTNDVSAQNHVIKTSGNTKVTVNIWIEDTDSNGKDYNGKTFTISNFKLIPFSKVRVYAVTAGEVGVTGGTVAVTGGTVTGDGESANKIVYAGESITIQALANSANDYSLEGWYETQTGGERISQQAGYSFTMPADTADISYYARFAKMKTTTIYILDRGYGDSSNNYALYAYAYGEESGTEYAGAWKGKKLTFNKALGMYKFEFKTFEEGEFGFMIADSLTNAQYPAANQDGLTGTIGHTYVLKPGNTSLESFTLGTKRAFYCSDNKSFGQMYYHTWYKTAAGTDRAKTEWPGTAMDGVAYTNPAGEKVYYCLYAVGSYKYIIFNNGSSRKQTVDITISTTQCRYYPNSSSSPYAVGTW